MYQADTISAIATAVGSSGIGIIRMSGKDAIRIADEIFVPKNGSHVSAAESHRALYGSVMDEGGRVIDEVLCLVMRTPHSYTKEDVVELQCHGGSLPLREILLRTWGCGARPAEPGEFTKRAFLNGRIDLIQAEAVMDIIKSRSEASLKMAVRQQDGQLSKKIKGLRRNLLDIVVNLEAVIDYPEEDIEEITFNTVSEGMEKVKQELEYLLKHAHTGKILR